jgi:PAS domain-containing protein
MDMSNGFFREILGRLDEGFFFVDRDRKITYWNGSAERITDYRKALSRLPWITP